jgi:hypothetical protein
MGTGSKVRPGRDADHSPFSAEDMNESELYLLSPLRLHSCVVGLLYCMHAYIHAYTHTHACIHTYTHTHTCMHTYIHTHAYTHTCIHTYIHTCIHTYMHTYTHTYMRTHIHTCVVVEFPVYRQRDKLVSWTCQTTVAGICYYWSLIAMHISHHVYFIWKAGHCSEPK